MGWIETWLRRAFAAAVVAAAFGAGGGVGLAVVARHVMAPAVALPMSDSDFAKLAEAALTPDLQVAADRFEAALGLSR